MVFLLVLGPYTTEAILYGPSVCSGTVQYLHIHTKKAMFLFSYVMSADREQASRFNAIGSGIRRSRGTYKVDT